jgi:hypothetical protein
MKKSIVLALVLTLLIFTCFIVFRNMQYYPSKGEQLVNKTLGKAAKIIKEKYNIRPCGAGVAMPGGPIQEVTLCFTTKYPYTKEQLRDLLIKSSAELLRQVIENEEIQEFLHERPFTIKNTEIVIYNHDEKGFRLKDPQISVANISQGELCYRTIDPEDSFKYKNKYKESYEEALKALSSP